MLSKEDFIRNKLLNDIETLSKLNGYEWDEYPKYSWTIKFSGYNDYCTVIYFEEGGFYLNLSRNKRVPLAFCKMLKKALSENNIESIIPELVEIALLHCFVNSYVENWYKSMTRKLKIRIL